MAYFDDSSSSKSQYDMDGNRIKRKRKQNGTRSLAESSPGLKGGPGESSTALGTR